MSLDVYLYSNEPQPMVEGSGIFIRENGETREITIEEWENKFPGTEPVVVRQENQVEDCELFTRNITHNVSLIASKADIHRELWRPDEIGITHANQLIRPLTEGLKRLCSNPEYYRQYNPENGWGSYEGLVQFVRAYLEACIKYPDATVRVSR
jgi:hypothetical protein